MWLVLGDDGMSVLNQTLSCSGSDLQLRNPVESAFLPSSHARQKLFDNIGVFVPLGSIALLSEYSTEN